MKLHPTREIIVDLFAGGGGASTAIHQATGRHPDVAINHNPVALAIHSANHPETRHLVCDVREVDPLAACTFDSMLCRVDALWMSPDCTHFSVARGGKPVEKGIRSLAEVLLDWLAALAPHDAHPRAIFLENVREFRDWGPVLENGRPCPDQKGLDYRRWVKGIAAFGYVWRDQELVAADYGAPTTRRRLFGVARRDTQPIIFPTPTHAPRDRAALTGKRPWVAAADVIDWSLPVPSIFGRKRPLAAKTQRRIARGIERFVIKAPRPFIVPVCHTKGGNQSHDAGEPLRTITTAKGGEFAVTLPRLSGTSVGVGGRAGQSPPRGLDEPLHTVTAKADRAIAVPTLIPRYGERDGQAPRVRDVAEPHPTVVPHGNGGDLAAAFLQKMAQNGIGARPDAPLLTAMAQAPRHYQVAAHLERQFSASAGADVATPVGTVMPGGSGKTAVVASVLDAYYATGVPASAEEPLRTATAKARHGLTSAFMEQANTGVVGHAASAPVSTIMGAGSHQRLVQVDLGDGERRQQVLAFLWEHFGDPTAAEVADPLATERGRLRFGLVLIDGAAWQIADVGMRMLTPRELFNAQGFPADYVIEVTLAGGPVTKTAQTSAAGNSVSPPPAEALLRANLTWMRLPEQRAA